MRVNNMCAIMSLTDAISKDLTPLTDARPVAALPFACRYRAIDFNLSNISHAGIDSVAIFIGGSGRSVYDHIRSGSVWDLESNLRGGIFTYSQTYLKQSMGMDSYENRDFYFNHREFLQKSMSRYVVVSGGRLISNINLIDMMNYHDTHDGEITLAYKKVPVDKVKGHPHEKVLNLDPDNDVIRLVDSGDYHYTEERVPQSMNTYILSVNKMLELIDRADKEGIRMDIDRLVSYYSQFYQMDAYEYKGHMANFDSIQAYYDANMLLLDKENYDELFHDDNQVITKVKNEAPTYYCKDAKVKRSLFATGCFIAGTVENSLIFRKVTVGSEAVIKDSIVMQGAKIGEGAVLEYCILDKNVTIEPGVVLKGSKDNLIVIEKNKTVTA